MSQPHTLLQEITTSRQRLKPDRRRHSITPVEMSKSRKKWKALWRCTLSPLHLHAPPRDEILLRCISFACHNAVTSRSPLGLNRQICAKAVSPIRQEGIESFKTKKIAQTIHLLQKNFHTLLPHTAQNFPHDFMRVAAWCDQRCVM